MMETLPRAHQGCAIPEDLEYELEQDVWVRFEPDGTITMGMTDPAQTRAGKLVSILFKRPGKVFQAGRSVATIESAKWVGPFPTPLSGELLEVNQARFEEDILIANRDPYGEGWLARLRPTDLPHERPRLTAGPKAFEFYKERIDRDGIRCYRCAD
ncbi:MAG: glycine cleavage system protein H [Candidatus Dormibacteria bacterium]